jgi:hypothetical protein
MRVIKPIFIMMFIFVVYIGRSQDNSEISTKVEDPTNDWGLSALPPPCD